VQPIEAILLIEGEKRFSCFSTGDSTARRKWRARAGEASKHLDLGTFLRHVVTSRQDGMLDLVAYVDGGSLGNPGPSGIGVVIDGCEQGKIEIAKWIGHQDNNVAEYVALLEALHCALALSAKALHVYSDSEVMVRQMKGEYACRSPRLYSLNWICRKLARSLHFSISHVSRENNAEANRLANSAARRHSSNVRTQVGGDPKQNSRFLPL
jgi:ribonuclease HI